METIEYEDISTGIVNFNLGGTGESFSSNKLKSPTGFLAENYSEPRIEIQNKLNSKWHIHYRE